MHSQFAACLVDSPSLHQFQAQSAFSKAFMQRNPGFAWVCRARAFCNLSFKISLAFRNLSFKSLSLSLSLSSLFCCNRSANDKISHQVYSQLTGLERVLSGTGGNAVFFFFLCLPLIRVELVPLVVCLVCCCAKSSWVSEDIYLLLPIIINLPTTNNNNPLWVVRILLLLLLQAIHQHPIHNNHNDNDQTPKYVCPPNCRKNLLATFSWYYLLLACWLQSLACLLACWVQALGTISCLLVGYKLLVQ